MNRYATELIGTFFLVFAIGMTAVLGTDAAPIAIGAMFAVFVADPSELQSNSQITGRTSPGLLDLAAALATGTAGAFAMSRRDLSTVLPGVAIAISLSYTAMTRLSSGIRPPSERR